MRCNDCKYKLNLERYDYSQGGCTHSDEDGYVCMAFNDEGIAIHMIGLNPNVDDGCEMYNAKTKQEVN